MNSFFKYMKLAFSIALGITIGLSLFIADTTTVVYSGLIMILFIGLFPEN